MKKLCVIGSLNTDLVAIVDSFPKPGETVSGREFGTFLGGKGANQAVAAGRLGADIRMVGKVGDDFYGQQYITALKNNGVDAQAVGTETGVSSGIAVIEVDASGENHIVIISGANGRMDRNYIDNQRDFILEADIFLLQLEIPLDTVIYVLQLLKANDKTVILDPAPARRLPDEIFRYVDYITPNETEMGILTGKNVGNLEELQIAAAELLGKGVGTVIAKVGKRGAYVITREESFHSPVFDVEVVDTTAAGDSFNAGFAYALARGENLKECARFANAVASLSTTGKGAQSAMPTVAQVMELMNRG